MTRTLVVALLALIPSSLLLVGSFVVFRRTRSLFAFVQLVGAGGFVLVVLTHLCEALRVLPWMQWGEPHSAGHYLDLLGALLGITLFPIGYIGRRVGHRSIRPH